MAIAFVQSNVGTQSGVSPAVTLAAGATAGNLIVTSCAAGANVTLTPPAGFTGLTNANSNSGSLRALRIAYKIATGGETTLTWGGTTLGSVTIAAEYSGISTSAPLDVEGSQVNAAATAQPTPSVSPVASANRLIVCTAAVGTAISVTYSAETIGGTSVGVTERQDSFISGASCAFYDQIVTSTSGTYSGNATASAGAPGLGAIAIFAASTASPNKLAMLL